MALLPEPSGQALLQRRFPGAIDPFYHEQKAWAVHAARPHKRGRMRRHEISGKSALANPRRHHLK
jgi:hypothetical protein